MTKHSFRYAAVLIVCITASLGLSVAAFGQSPPTPDENRYTYRYADPGEPTITVHIWGGVGNSGIWKVEPATDLVELLSAARLTALGPDNPDTRREVNLRIHRLRNGERRTIYRAELKNVLSEGKSYPGLEDGDILEVEVNNRRRKFQWVTQIVGTASSIALLILRLSRGR